MEQLKEINNNPDEISSANENPKEINKDDGDRAKEDNKIELEVKKENARKEMRRKRLDVIFVSASAIYCGAGFIIANIRGVSLFFIFDYYWPSMIGIIMVMFGTYFMLRRVISLSTRSEKGDFVEVDKKYTEINNQVKFNASDYNNFREIAKDLLANNEESKEKSKEQRDQVEQILKQTITTLEQKANAADEKASLLLQRGVSYTKFGIGYYLLSILLWQAMFLHYGFKKEYIYGIASCSFLFLFIEFLSAWFLKQYKNFTDNSVYLIKIKSFFDRFLIVYSIESKEPVVGKETSKDYDKTIALLSKDLMWPDISVIESKENSFAKDTISSISELINAVNKKETKENKSNSTRAE